MSTATPQWSRQQEEALRFARAWIDAPRGSVPQVFRLEGPAGTGKSTLAHALWEHTDGRALGAAYTGKAASVLNSKGIPSTTIHRLIYEPAGTKGTARAVELAEELETLESMAEAVTDPDRGLLQRIAAVRRQLEEAKAEVGQPRFTLKPYSDVSDVPLIILDEHSMVDQRMGEDLLSFGTKVLALGDPAQLPPVRGTGFFTGCGQPDVLLTEIHRQARDNPIIALATLVREGRSLPLGDWGAARVTNERVTPAQALAADQILCGTNNRRRAINARHRQLAGHDSPMPVAGEKLVCLQNNHDLGLLNGTQWVTTADSDWTPGDPTVGLTIRPLDGGEPMLIPAEASVFLDEDQRPKWGGENQFTFGSAMTVHKAQGSQWDDVILFDDWPSSKGRKEWLYTGITRAAKTLTVVRL